MKFTQLRKFANDQTISEKTLKRKYGDLIHREGRQAFIDTERFEEVFPERSRTGKLSTKPVTKSNSIKRITLAISQKNKKANTLSFRMVIISKKQKAEKDPIQVDILEVDRRKNSSLVQDLRDDVVILEERRSDLIQKELNELAEFAVPVAK